MFAQDRLEVTPTEVASTRDVLLVDIREPFERDLCAIGGSLHVPMGEIPVRWQEVAKDLPIVLYCHSGIRSLYATRYLRAEGIDAVWSLEGGIDLWARSIDPEMPRY